MAEPDLVAECVVAMRAATTLPITVKTRIGIDARDSYAELADFTGKGCYRRMRDLYPSRPQSMAERLESEGKPGNSTAVTTWFIVSKRIFRP